MSVKLIGVQKSFGDFEAVRKLDLEIMDGEFFSILGPSGCGKTTLLRLLGGFESPTSGTIELNGERIDPLPPHLRQFNTVFQRYALFPHLNVFENIAFGLRMKKAGKSEIEERVNETLDLVQMREFATRSVSTLSGGQQQRIAVARALVNRPKVLLLDEPLSALDLKLRQQMKMELLSLQRKLKQTFIFVTHDQEEALTVSDRVAVMNQGRLEQVGTPQEIYEFPQSLFVARFIGSMNSLECEVKDASELLVTLQGFGKRALNVKPSRDRLRPLPKVSIAEKVQIMVRPEKLKVLKSLPGPEQNAVEGVIKEVLYKGPETQFLISSKDGQQLLTAVQVNSAVTARRPFTLGEKVFATWAPEDCLLMGLHGVLETWPPRTLSESNPLNTEEVARVGAL